MLQYSPNLAQIVGCTMAFVTTCSILHFLFPKQRWDISKLPNITILRWNVPSKLISKCCNSMNWDTGKGFFQHWLLVILWLIWGYFLTLTGQKSSWRWGGGGVSWPFKLSNRKGHITPLAPVPPDLSFCLERRQKLRSLFLTTFPKQKHLFGTQTRCFTIWSLKRRRIYEVQQ
jgi:hypothetical protein